MGTLNKTSLISLYMALCNPSLYGSKPPMSNRIIRTHTRVLTSFVLPIHNQGVSLAPLQGHALWKKFLPTTGSFLCVLITTLLLVSDLLSVVALFSADVFLLLPTHFTFLRCLLNWALYVSHHFLCIIYNSFCQHCIKYSN